MGKITGLLFGVLISGCAVAPEEGAVHTDADSSALLVLDTATANDLSGHFANGPTGVRFESLKTEDSVYFRLTTLDGRELIATEDFGDAYVMRYLDGRLTARIPKTAVGMLEARPEDASVYDLVEMEGDASAIEEFLGSPEAELLPWLSRALGRRGLTGVGFGSTVAVHQLAKQSAKRSGLTLPPLELDVSIDDWTAQRADFQAYHGTTCSTGYDGQCGPPGTCWSWVCGGGGHYSGCYTHDQWCYQCHCRGNLIGCITCYSPLAVVALFCVPI